MLLRLSKYLTVTVVFLTVCGIEEVIGKDISLVLYYTLINGIQISTRGTL